MLTRRYVVSQIVWVVGVLFGFGVTVVYFFRRKPVSAREGRAIADQEVTKIMKQLVGDTLTGTASKAKKQ